LGKGIIKEEGRILTPVSHNASLLQNRKRNYRQIKIKCRSTDHFQKFCPVRSKKLRYPRGLVGTSSLKDGTM
jgi:hypothetical protein